MARAFVKWAGGKTWLTKATTFLADEISADRVVEPFLGGGAVSLAAERPFLGSDVIPDLIVLWNCVAADWERVEEGVRGMPISEDAYLALRDTRPTTDFERSIRFLYLNRACYGGLHRVNQSGDFNVPFGFRFDRNLLPNGRLQSAATFAARAEFMECSFEQTLERVLPGDFLFVDPPYFLDDAGHRGFRRFTAKPFCQEDLVSCIDLTIEASKTTAVSIICLGSEVGSHPSGSKPLLAAGWRPAGVRQLVDRSEHVYSSLELSPEARRVFDMVIGSYKRSGLSRKEAPSRS